jgi:hypothetical protein
VISINDLVSPANGVVAALLRSPLHFIASKGLMLLGWSGRTSGRTFSIPVGYQRKGDVLIVLISKRDEKSWWKNFRTPWPADLHVRGERHTAMGEVIAPGSEAFFEHIEGTLKRLPWMGGQFGGARYDAAVGLTEAQRATLCEHVGAVRFEITD